MFVRFGSAGKLYTIFLYILINLYKLLILFLILVSQASDKLVSPKLGKPYDQWLDERISNFNRRNGLPIGDDLYVSHVNTEWLKQKLERRKAISGLSVQRPPREPLVQRTPSKPLNELRAIFTNTTSLKVQTNVDC